MNLFVPGTSREYLPDGPSEECLVQTMVDLDWRRRRLVRYEEIKLKKTTDGDS